MNSKAIQPNVEKCQNNVSFCASDSKGRNEKNIRDPPEAKKFLNPHTKIPMLMKWSEFLCKHTIALWAIKKASSTVVWSFERWHFPVNRFSFGRHEIFRDDTCIELDYAYLVPDVFNVIIFQLTYTDCQQYLCIHLIDEPQKISQNLFFTELVMQN